MATYVPNATEATEPVESRAVESAALEFRTLKTRINALEVAVAVEDVKDLRAPEAIIAEIPALADRAGKVLGFDAGGDPVAIEVAGTTDPSLRSDLAASSGASLVGYLPAGTGAVATDVQAKLRAFPGPEDQGLIASGSTAVDAAFALMCTEYAGSGKTITLPPGNYRITQSHEVSGFTLALTQGAEIEVYGTDPTTFNQGGIKLTNGGVLFAGGVYTNGTMIGAFDNSCAVYCDGGSIKGFTEVYSQLYACVRQITPADMEVSYVGGIYRGFEAKFTTDAPCNLKLRYSNSGVPHVNKLYISSTLTDSRAALIYASVTMKSRVNVDVSGRYSQKNGVWFETSDAALYTFNDVYLTGKVSKAGYYLDGSGVEQLGDGAGTCVELLSCPNAVVNMETYDPRGYNVAIASFSHGAKVSGGYHQGTGGDPNIVIANSDDTVVSSRTAGGTVGVSIGEDGATSNNCKILSHVFENCTANPVKFSNGNKLSVVDCTFSGEPTLTTTTGNWTGPGEIKAAVSVLQGANDVVFTGSTLSGWFTHDVIAYDHSGELRIARCGNKYNAPIMARSDIQYQTIHSATEGATPLMRVLDDTDTTGYSGVGEITILGTDGTQYSLVAINPLLADVTSLVQSGEVEADVLGKYAVLVYIKYYTAMQGLQIRFGITSSFNASQSGSTFYSPFTGIAGSNSIAGKLHQLADGAEWIPLVFSLDEIIYNSANKAALTYFLVNKSGSPTTYDLTITKPVLFYLGDASRVA